MPAKRDEPSAPPEAEKVTLAGSMIGLGPIGKHVPSARGIRFPYDGVGTLALVGRPSEGL